MRKLCYGLLFGILLSQSSIAKTNSAISRVVNGAFEGVTKIEAKQVILNSMQYKQIKKEAKTAIRTKIYRYYVIEKNHTPLGYGILMMQKVRTKKATVLYTFDRKGNLKFTEIMAFGEPPEYIPNKQWMDQFNEVEPSAALTLGKDIPTISGATLSARAISDGARVARALYHVVIKK